MLIFVLGQDRDSSVDEFDVHPVDEQRGLAELDERAESPVDCIQFCYHPAAPSVGRDHDHEQHPDPDQKKLGTGKPVVVDGINLARLRVEPAGELDEHGPGCAQAKKDAGLVCARPFGLQDESDGEAGEGEARPGENGEEPCTGTPRLCTPST